MSALPSLRDIITEYQLITRKALGQHFLLDSNLTDKIARAARPLDKGTTIEIGPGPGGLTRSLLNADVQHLIAIEKDERCIAALETLIEYSAGRLTVLAEDALKVDIHTLGSTPRKVVANLPYNISTLLLLQWLPHIQAFESLTLMFQREVAERLCAEPNTKAYGRLSVMTQWVTDVTMLFHIPPQAFVPPPKIFSTVVHLQPKKVAFDVKAWKAMETVTAAAFNQRRKMLRSSLSSLWGSKTQATLEIVGIESTCRAEDLSVEHYWRLAQVIMNCSTPTVLSPESS